MLSACKHCPGVVVEYIARRSYIGNPSWQNGKVWIFLDLVDAAVSKQDTCLKSLLLTSVQHKLDILQARLVKSPTAICASPFWCPAFGAEECKQVGLRISRAKSEI